MARRSTSASCTTPWLLGRQTLEAWPCDRCSSGGTLVGAVAQNRPRELVHARVQGIRTAAPLAERTPYDNGRAARTR